MADYTSNGGGATHIAKVTGQLKDLSSNLSDILIVSGGGGGGLLVDETEYAGADAGGVSGSGDNSADQSTGYAFGQGESGTDVSGGGGGLYGGYKGHQDVIPPIYDYIQNLNKLYLKYDNDASLKRDFFTADAYDYNNPHPQITNFNPTRASVYGVTELVTSTMDSHVDGYWRYAKLCAFEPLTIIVTTGQTVSISYSNTTKSHFWDGSYGNNSPCCEYWGWGSAAEYGGNSIMQEQSSNPSVTFTTSFNNLSDAIEYIYKRFSNVTLIVDGETWVSI